ncbi:ABC transporter transmembrane domain-containing protein [Massilia sp. SM-13]|uniref:ABC transporter transmembrane domain-containing protein n=1 Tax=Pseudoduganella rhizocola TaxID=3382643 RepID=UPI0038B595E4
MSLTSLFRALLAFARPMRGALCVVGVILLAEIAFNAALPYSFKFIVDDGILRRNGQLLVSIIAGLAIAALLVSALGLWRDYLYSRLTNNMVAAIRYRMFSHLQYQSLGFYSRSQAGDLLGRFAGDVNAVAHALESAPAWAVIPLLDVVTHTVLLFVIDWRLALVALAVCPIILLGPKFFSPRAAVASADSRNQEGGVLSIVQESLAAQPTVKALTFQKPLIGKFDSQNQVLALSKRRVGFLSALVERSAGSGILLMQVVITGTGALMVYHDQMSTGEFVAFQSLFVTLSYSLMYIAQYVPTLIEATGGMARVMEILDEPADIQDAPDAAALPPFQHEIRLEDLSFGYSPEVRNLNQVSLQIRKGENVAFVGPSGSGKSTVVSLLMRFFDPQSGAVRYDGHDIRQVTQQSLRDNIAIVFQENFLFNISLRENIRMGRLAASDAEVEDAARGAEIHDFILTLPQGYDTPAGERGSRLSGGQRQRIGIARALLRNPAILILDEATSALDPVTETAINQTLARVAHMRTVISVTHRLGSVVDCDRIFVMERGVLKESGTHAELLAAQGLYASLASKQHGISISEDGEEASVTPEKLRSVPVLQEVPEELLVDLASQFGMAEFPAGRVVFEEGDAGDRFYLIAHGSVEILKAQGEGEAPHRVAVLRDGDYFGELALLTHAPRNASVSTLTHCLMLTLPRAAFRNLLKRAPELQERLLRRYQPEAQP